MKASAKQILTILHVVCWVVFIGLLINAGAIPFSYGISLFIPEGANNLYKGLDLSALKRFSIWYYTCIVSFLVVLPGLKAYLFYLVIRIFSKIDFDHPFSPPAAALILKISQVALGTGILGIIADGYGRWLDKNDLASVDTLRQYWSGSTEFLLLAGIIFVIAQIFQRGVEIQSENELTI